MIGYYGGLRPKEVRLLKFVQLEGPADELMIFIDRSKTPESRRWVPMFALAPRWVCEWLVQMRDKEKAHHRSQKARRDSYLFSYGDYSGPLEADHLIAPATAVLKQAFGNNAVFYSLRHSFASLNLLRIVALGYPALMSELADRKHETFSSPHLERFREVLSTPEDLAPPIPYSSIGTLCEMMGHAGYRTLFERYVHTNHIALRHFTTPMYGQQGERALSRKACSNITGLTSSSSLARLPRTVAGLIDYLRESSSAERRR